MRGAFALAALRVRRPRSWRIVAQPGELIVEFDYPAQCPSSLVMYRTLVEPEYALVSRTVPEEGVFVDVGGGIGTYSLLAGKRPGVDLHVFEPVAENVATIRRNLKANGIRGAHVHPQVVSGLCGSADLDRGRNLFVTRVARVFDRPGRGEVAAVTLDHYCRERGIERVHFLKIDVEGHESAVLAGGRGMFERGAVDVAVIEAGAAYAACREVLARNGYLLCFYHLEDDALIELTDSEHRQLVTHRPTEFHSNVVAVAHTALGRVADRVAVRRR